MRNRDEKMRFGAINPENKFRKGIHQNRFERAMPIKWIGARTQGRDSKRFQAFSRAS